MPNIKIKNRIGEEVTYEGIDVISVPSASGEDRQRYVVNALDEMIVKIGDERRSSTSIGPSASPTTYTLHPLVNINKELVEGKKFRAYMQWSSAYRTGTSSFDYLALGDSSKFYECTSEVRTSVVGDYINFEGHHRFQINRHSNYQTTYYKLCAQLIVVVDPEATLPTN